MLLPKQKAWLSNFRKTVLYAFITLIITISVSLFGIITYTSSSAKDNSRKTFESSLWCALQLQIQSYRLLDYLVELDESAFPLKGDAFFEYDLLMSRIDLLREGEIGSLIRNFEKGRVVKQLNLINGELELLSFNISKLEQGDISYLTNIIERIQRLQPKIDEFVSLVNKGSTEYINKGRKDFEHSLNAIQFLSMVLLICLLLLSFFTVKALIKLQKSLRETNELKTGMQAIHEDKANMLSFIHQELRSPIHAIQGIAQTVKNTPSAQSSSELSEHIEEAGDQLLQSIEMFSDLAQIETDRFSLLHITDNLQKHVEACLMQFESQMARKGLQSIAYIDPLLPKDITIDFNRFKEIIISLLQNTLIHTPSGSISVQIRPSILAIPLMTTPPASTQETRMLQIAVKDTGLGMPDQLQENLRMNPLLPQNEESILRRIGLNLALCNKLVKCMNGEIHFYNTPKKGCEFWVDIPYYVERDATQIDKPKKAPSHQPYANRHVLLIEEDSHLAKVLSNQLATFGLKATLFKEGSNPSKEKLDAVILGNSTWLERDGLDMMEQWKKQGTPILSYSIDAVKQDEQHITQLSFPLLQSQIEKRITQLFK
ncbi:ATP-binding protein [Marinomonas sp. 5E14-1]|uniref:ATP-binding protein n=1 Tax=Marinomonas sp. 5E14-1 TaxID=3153922 RepID=UPI0032635FF5